MEIIKGPGGEADVQSLIKAIKASEVLENRIPLISQLGDLQITEASELASLVECLLSFWEDSQCSGASQCALNKTILLIAAKYFELGTCSHLQQFLILGIKAGMWCNKHVHMEVLSMEDSPEESHSDIFSQLILEDLSFCSAAFSSMAKNPILGEKALMLSFEQFISEQLHLTRASITDIKKIHSASSEVPKVVQVVLDASVKLCRAYSQAAKWHCDLADQDTNEGSIVGGNRADDVAHAINIAACTVENLCKLGVLAAAGGGTLVSVLNASWKGVVTILQLGKGVLSGNIDIREIILSLISLSVESLRRTAEAWFLKETIDLSEAKRMCLLVKFYLINTVRVTSMYPIEAFSIYKEITQCVLIITSLRILLSKEICQRAGSEALYEAVEPTSLCLLNTLLNSTDLVEDKKFEIIDWLFPVEGKTISRHPVQICDTTTNPADEIFSMNCETGSSAGALLLGRFILFLNLLKSSPDLREELVLGFSRKLGFLLDAMVNEDVYSSVLVLHIPDLCASIPSAGLNWQPMFDFVLHSLKTFMIVAASNPAWQEVEFFLLKNIIHPHFLCREIITELWCFFIRHANAEVLDSILDTLCSLVKVIALSEPALTPLCSLRKIARTLCDILTSASQCSVDQVYSSITDDYISNPHISSAVHLALLIEGIPLNSLSDQRKRLSTQRIISAYHNSMEKNSKNLEAGTLLGSFCGVVLGLPVVALSAALISRQMESSDIGDTSDSSLLKFTISIIHGYRNSSVTLKDQFSKLLSAALDIIPNMKRLYASDEMSEVIAELHTLFVSDTVTSKETWLNQCKPSLASFMAGLSEMEFTEGEGSATYSAVWELYHMLLRERHWALIHLSMTAFGSFSSCTSCTQLWRFVPHDAALSFDVETGNDTNEDSFILEMKAFLEKERALPSATPCVEQLHFLANEGHMLKEKIINTQRIDIEVPESKPMEIDDKIPVKKKRKLPDGFNEGMALLQSGFKVMSDALAQWKQEQEHTESVEPRDEFLTHLSCLEDVMAHLVSLSDRG